MNEENLSPLQLAEYEMLKDVANFCEENGINYFLSAGTLLGAIRHGGFIPWDDDIDIGMDLKNYKKFLSLTKKGFSEKYFIQHFSTEAKINNPWIKVRINGTTSMEPFLNNYDIHYGICMDIFLFNGISDNPFHKFLQKKFAKRQRELLGKYINIELGGHKNNKLYVRFLPEFLRRFLIKFYERVIDIDISKTKYCYNNYFTDIGESCRFQSDWFKNLIKADFENREFYVPSEYGKYLTARYGDWKTPPPIKDRRGHGNIIIDCENNYTLYQGEKLKRKKLSFRNRILDYLKE